MNTKRIRTLLTEIPKDLQALCKEAFFNYVDQIEPIIDHLPIPG